MCTTRSQRSSIDARSPTLLKSRCASCAGTRLRRHFCHHQPNSRWCCRPRLICWVGADENSSHSSKCPRNGGNENAKESIKEIRRYESTNQCDNKEKSSVYQEMFLTASQRRHSDGTA